MAVSASFVKSLGKSVAFTSLDVAAHYAPNTADLIRGAAFGVKDLRSSMLMMRQVDRSTVGRNTRRYLETAMKGIREGNISMDDLA